MFHTSLANLETLVVQEDQVEKVDLEVQMDQGVQVAQVDLVEWVDPVVQVVLVDQEVLVVLGVQMDLVVLEVREDLAGRHHLVDLENQEDKAAPEDHQVLVVQEAPGALVAPKGQGDLVDHQFQVALDFLEVQEVQVVRKDLEVLEDLEAPVDQVDPLLLVALVDQKVLEDLEGQVVRVGLLFLIDLENLVTLVVLEDLVDLEGLVGLVDLVVLVDQVFQKFLETQEVSCDIKFEIKFLPKLTVYENEFSVLILASEKIGEVSLHLR